MFCGFYETGLIGLGRKTLARNLNDFYLFYQRLVDRTLDITVFIINLFDCICVMYINDDNIVKSLVLCML